MALICAACGRVMLASMLRREFFETALLAQVPVAPPPPPKAKITSPSC
jgi:hypothetical protein